ncbi:aminotransferase class IV, partial [Acinetobacter baumannii]
MKTTSRAIYRELQDLAGECDEVLLYNGRGELTEFSNGGLLMKFGDRWFTPPIECGCLPSIGVSRSEAEKRILRVESLADADEIVMVNARGRWRAV